MPEFHEGCLVCVSREKGSCPEKCFECAQPDVRREDGIHSLGFYFPRFREGYKSSKWSQAVIKAKKKSLPVISSFGKIVAHYMDGRLAELKPYLITNVPAYPSEVPSLFSDYEFGLTRLLAFSVFANLKDRKWVCLEQLLVQNRKKARKQHRCKTDAQRRRNIQGIYAVQEPDKVEGRNIILLDDVITSGATMRECTTLLFEAGAKTVVGVALAKTFRMNFPTPGLVSCNHLQKHERGKRWSY